VPSTSKPKWAPWAPAAPVAPPAPRAPRAHPDPGETTEILDLREQWAPVDCLDPLAILELREMWGERVSRGPLVCPGLGATQEGQACQGQTAKKVMPALMDSMDVLEWRAHRESLERQGPLELQGCQDHLAPVAPLETGGRTALMDLLV